MHILSDSEHERTRPGDTVAHIHACKRTDTQTACQKQLFGFRGAENV
jgi:hypothetical protein